MQPRDTEAAEEALWADFVQRLAGHLAAQWPEMPERLGDRYAAFVDHAVQQAEKRGLQGAAAVARYVNLCFVWGPAFQDKPGFEWAAGLLAAPREREWAVVHQLQRRSLAELQRLPESRIAPAALAAADERLLGLFGALGRRGALQPAEPPLLPQAACDLEGIELRLLEPAVAEQPVLQGGQWQRVPLPLPAPLRVTLAQPAPRLVAVLSRPPGARSPARLQLRTRLHAVCDGDRHPVLRFAGTHGVWAWRGAETRAVSWPVATLDQAGAPAGPGTAIAEETSPDIHKLDLEVCGLRDEGDALGSLALQVWVWPAAQWWIEIERQAAPAQPVIAARGPAQRGSTRCRVECDGQVQDATPLRSAFEQGLDTATEGALQALLAAASQIEGVTDVRLEGQLALLVGRAALCWGWRLGPGGLAGRALMRIVGEIDLQACQSDLQVECELALAGGRARLVLRCAGAAPLALKLQREAAEPPLLPLLLPAKVAFNLPFKAELTPYATDGGALLQAAGPCKGALVGEAGLRPRTSGGSGFEWYASLRLEAASLPLLLLDPVLGAQTLVHPLWPEQTLFDWRLS